MATQPSSVTTSHEAAPVPAATGDALFCTSPDLAGRQLPQLVAAKLRDVLYRVGAFPTGSLASDPVRHL
jgi:hypothetical protein